METNEKHPDRFGRAKLFINIQNLEEEIVLQTFSDASAFLAGLHTLLVFTFEYHPLMYSSGEQVSHLSNHELTE